MEYGIAESCASIPRASLPLFHCSDLPVGGQQRHWLFSRRADFWLACAGASVALFAAVLVILWHGDRELDALDFVLSEFHLGATYDAVLRRRLWRHHRVDVLLIPLLILTLTYALSLGGHTILLTSIAMYAAVWHRGRQGFGVARFYQRQVGGPVSRAHNVLFYGAVYLPMLAAVLAYTHLAPMEYDGQPYMALSLGPGMAWIVGVTATLWVIAYLSWTLRHRSGAPFMNRTQNVAEIHPGERWVVLAQALALGSGYVLGASNASFLLVLAVHHEVQYLYFTYAMARRTATLEASEMDNGSVRNELDSKASYNAVRAPQPELRFAASFLTWPVVGFAGAIVGGWLQLGWLAPMGVGGLFCHYWLDGRIWARKSFQN
jgi:hypothetical protein